MKMKVPLSARGLSTASSIYVRGRCRYPHEVIHLSKRGANVLTNPVYDALFVYKGGAPSARQSADERAIVYKQHGTT